MADFGTFDLARAYSQAEDIKGARQGQQLRDLQIQGAQLELAKAQQPEKLTYDQMYQNTQMLHAAATDVAMNPARAGYWEQQLKAAQAIPGEFSLADIPPNELQTAAAQMAKETGSVLAALDPKAYGGDVDDKRSPMMQIFVEQGGDPRDHAAFKTFYDAEKAREKQATERSPYFMPVYTGSGVGSFNTRTGTATPIVEGGAGVLKTTDDPNVRAAVTGAEETAKLNAQRAQQIEVKVANMATMGSMLDEATPLVLAATGSDIGAVADRMARVFGFTPSGAEATSSLQVMAARLLEMVPRMEGPQSDADRATYEGAVGKLGDPSVTRDSKMAAIRTIRSLNKKYKLEFDAKAAPAAGGAAPMRKYNPETGKIE